MIKHSKTPQYNRNKSLKIYRTSKNSAYKFKKFSVCLSCTAEETPPALLPDNIQNGAFGRHLLPTFFSACFALIRQELFSLCFLFFLCRKKRSFYFFFSISCFHIKTNNSLYFLSIIQKTEALRRNIRLKSLCFDSASELYSL